MVSVLKLTRDSWYPSFYLDGCPDKKFVEVSFLKLDNKMWRVCAWGNDDFGMELDFDSSKKDLAFSIFIRIIKQDFVDQEYLKARGFTRA